jgi:peptidoglycan/LPS O-acetylase OafA/YrhL
MPLIMAGHSMNSDGKVTFHGLDALRGIAAVAVVVYHARGMLGLPSLMASGFLAVDMFFLMSGFVIAHAYDGRIPSIGSGGFIRTRLIRLYPIYLLGLAFGLIRVLGISITGGVPDGVMLAAASYFSFLPSPHTGFSDGAFSPLNGPAWSLILEFWINVAYALLFRRLTTLVLICVVALSAAALVWLTVFGDGIHGGSNLADAVVGLARVSFGFPLGILLYRHRNRLPKIPSMSTAIVAVLLLFLTLPESNSRSLLVVLVVSPFLVYCASMPQPAGLLARYGSKTSYCLYAIHLPLLITLNGVCNQLGLQTAGPTAVLILSLLVGCWWIDKYYDQPVRKWMRKRWKPAPIPT